jgi:hypothetical protein
MLRHLVAHGKPPPNHPFNADAPQERRTLVGGVIGLGVTFSF